MKGPHLYDRIFQEFSTPWHEFQEALNHVYEFYGFEEARPIRFLYLLYSEEATHLPEFRVKANPYAGNFR